MSDGMLEAYSVVREMFKTEAEIANRDAEIVELGKKLTQSEASTASMITRQRYQTLSPRLCQQQLPLPRRDDLPIRCDFLVNLRIRIIIHNFPPFKIIK